MTLSTELEEVLEALEEAGISTRDPLYLKVKMIKATIDGMEQNFINRKEVNGK